MPFRRRRARRIGNRPPLWTSCYAGRRHSGRAGDPPYVGQRIVQGRVDDQRHLVEGTISALQRNPFKILIGVETSSTGDVVVDGQVAHIGGPRQALGRQASAIGRPACFGTRVLVPGEPTAALGVRESATMLKLIGRVRERGAAVLFITHYANHAYSSGDYFRVLRNGEVPANFARTERAIGEVIEFMAGGPSCSP